MVAIALLLDEEVRLALIVNFSVAMCELGLPASYYGSTMGDIMKMV